jgi:positive regulator of sigma E activity
MQKILVYIVLGSVLYSITAEFINYIKTSLRVIYEQHYILATGGATIFAAAIAGIVTYIFVKRYTQNTEISTKIAKDTVELNIFYTLITGSVIAIMNKAFPANVDSGTAGSLSMFISVAAFVAVFVSKKLIYAPATTIFIASPVVYNMLVNNNISIYITESTLLLSSFMVYYLTTSKTKTATATNTESTGENMDPNKIIGTNVQPQTNTNFVFEDEQDDNLVTNAENVKKEIELREKHGVVVFLSVTPASQSAHNAADITKFLRKVGVKYPQAIAEKEKLKAMKTILDEEFPWLEDVNKKAVENAIVFAALHGEAAPLQMRPMLLLGPPGIGKTQWARRMAELSGTENKIISLAGKSSAQGLKSSERLYSGSGPSVLLNEIFKSGVANPVIVLDEVDKAENNQQGGGVQGVLLQLLEKNTAKRFYDDFLEGEVDLSHIIFVATANDKGSVSEPLLSRMDVLDLVGPRPEHAPNLAKTMTKDIANEFGLSDIPILKVVEPTIAKKLADGENLREIRNAVANVYRQQVLKKEGMA